LNRRGSASSLMKHLSYFIALFAIGSFALLMALEPVAAMLAAVLMGAFGVDTNAENIKTFEYCSIAALWAGVLIVTWVRARGLSPRAVKPGTERRLVIGHAWIFAGHGLLLCALLVPSFGDLMILPIVGVLLAYFVGILLVETARNRGPVLARN
jgi:hypothetical protein